MKRKLKSRAGETLAETLVTILIIALGTAAFATMVSVSGNINIRAGSADQAFYEELSRAEQGGEPTTAITVTVGADTVEARLTGGGGALASYRVEGGGAP